MKRRLRLLLAVPSSGDPAHRRVARALAARYRARGHRVRVFSPAVGAADAAAAGAFAALLRAQRSDAAHVHCFSRGSGFLGRVRFPPGLRLVLTHQGAALDLLEGPAAFRRALARADRVTAVSAAGLRELGAFAPGIRRKACLVYNGTDPFPARGGRPAGRPFVLTVGRIAAYKGLDLMALAFAGLLADGADLDWAAVGPDQTGGEFQRFLRRLGIADRVRLTGALPPRRVASLLARCLFFAHPSRLENMPMALLEAMAAGKAVAASRAGGIPEAVADGRSGLLFPAGSVRGLQAALTRLHSDSGLRTRLGRAALRRARDFSWDRIADRYLELLGA
ncbi:MAG TPA: hypothetical protein DD417_20360 [Elusimicrobia bacterium]|nr:hypothetical protein [Elusimicrobiota bacterium]